MLPSKVHSLDSFSAGQKLLFDRQHPSRPTRIIFDDAQIIKQGFKNIHGASNIEEALQLQAWADASVERRC